MGMHRSYRRRLDKMDAAEAKVVNKKHKDKERIRRDARMALVIKAGDLPYAPAVMSWLSRKLDKPSSRITQEDVGGLMS